MYGPRSVPHLHPRALASIAGERIVHLLRPLLPGEDSLAVRALRVPRAARLAGDGEAPERHARVDDAALEEVGVRAREDVREHRAGGGADGEDPARVDAPVLQRVPHGGGDAEGVAAAVVLERLVGGDVPAAAGAGLRVRGGG